MSVRYAIEDEKQAKQYWDHPLAKDYENALSL
jgi:hypothetical protein